MAPADCNVQTEDLFMKSYSLNVIIFFFCVYVNIEHTVQLAFFIFFYQGHFEEMRRHPFYDQRMYHERYDFDRRLVIFFSL